MILAIDVGNTNIVMGCIDLNGIHFKARLSTLYGKTFEQYAVELKNIFELYKFDLNNIEGAIVSCVALPLIKIITDAVKLVTGHTPIIVEPGTKTGLNIMTDDPGQLGSDLVVAAVAALDSYDAPLVIFDFGTATTASVIDSKKAFRGGTIFPGVDISLQALTHSTAQLPKISVDSPSLVIGGNTIDSMNSGIVFGNASMMDGMVERIEEELGEHVTVIVTGGLSEIIFPHCKTKVIHDPDIILRGLYLIYKKNCK